MHRRLCCVVLASLASLAAFSHAQSTATLHLVFVVDGLRPDSIDPTETPNLYRLRKEGVVLQVSEVAGKRYIDKGWREQ